jgi:hypothetical protein
MTVFWMALAGLLALAPRALAIAGLSTLAAGLLFSNRTWEDKSFYLPSRAPASAACLREWRAAPPGCHHLLFQWGDGWPADYATLAAPLDKEGLSVFGPRRTYLLQGDVVLARVKAAPPGPEPFLSRDGVTRGDPNEFRRLDLILAPGTAVAWRVDLPSNLESAKFETRVRASKDELMIARGARVSVAGAGEADEARALVPAGGDEPLSLDLRPFAGKTVTLRLTAEEAAAGAPLILEAPRVELRLAH